MRIQQILDPDRIDGFRLGGVPQNKMEVSSANGAGGKPNDRTTYQFDFRLRDIIETDVSDSMRYDCFHLVVPWPLYLGFAGSSLMLKDSGVIWGGKARFFLIFKRAPDWSGEQFRNWLRRWCWANPRTDRQIDSGTTFPEKVIASNIKENYAQRGPKTQRPSAGK